MMKNLRITVNGTTYDVQVEELGESSAPAAAPAAPAPAPAAKKAAAPAPAAAGGEPVVAPMPGTILDVKVSVGDTVSEGQAVAILEAMKMENDINAPCAGKVLSVNVNKGETVETGSLVCVIG
jgi:biotin carboxyl carrier protein